MSKTLKKWEIIGFIFVVALGSLGHFLYEWSGNLELVGRFFSVNESTWEHLKLLFFPYVVFMIVEWFYIGKNYRGFAFSKLIGAVSGMALIVVLFYTYTGIVGNSSDFLNILIFVLAAAFSFYVSFRLLTGGMKTTLIIPSLIAFLVIAILFVIFTKNPPKINLFKDPLSNSFGIDKILDAAYAEYNTKLL